MLNPSDDNVIIPVAKTEKRVEQQEEKYELLMDYPDPFNTSSSRTKSYYQSYQPAYDVTDNNNTSNRNTNKTEIKRNHTITKTQSTNNDINEKIDIQYIGMVNNTNPYTKTAYIQYNDEYFLCQPGDSIQSLIIQSFTKDKLTIDRNDSIIYFDKIGND